MKKQNLTISIPFPAWDGIFKVSQIADELRRHEMLKGIPTWLNTPRRITIRQGEIVEGLDDVKVVEYWYTSGCYVTVIMEGHDHPSYGTSWKLVDLRIRWRDFILHLPTDEERLELSLHVDQLRIVGLTAHLREHICDYDGKNLVAAKKHLAEATSESEAVVDRLAEPISRSYERQQVRRREVNFSRQAFFEDQSGIA